MSWDATNDVVVLFGGSDGTANLGDTWEYDPQTNAWTQTSSTGPSARAWPGLACDSSNAVCVLFGGYSDAGPQADTWEYDASTNVWTETTPGTSPPALLSYALAYHAQMRLVILVGMEPMSQQMVTWAYDASVDAWQDRGPASPPDARTFHALAYFQAVNRIVLFGGASPTDYFGDTWEFDYGANQWTTTVAEGQGPPERTRAALTHRPSSSSVFMFGGTTAGTPWDDTWEYFDDAGSRTWILVPGQRSPGPRHTFGLADEASNGESVLFGGVDSAGGMLGDTWAFGLVFSAQGSLVSSVHDSLGANVNWDTITWVGSQPAGTILRFQLASSDAPTGPFSCVGPLGGATGYYTTSGTAIWSGHDNDRHLRYCAYFLAFDNLLTPTLDEITITYDVPPADPFIAFTDPADGDFDVPQTDPIFVRFSEPMDIASVTWTITPAVVVTPTWSEADSALTLDHAAPLAECQAYVVEITGGTDQVGNPLVPGPVSNPWTFFTLCDPPEILSTNPAQGDTDVPLNEAIAVTFSEPMDTASVTWTIAPSIALDPTWSAGDTVLTLSHTVDFPQCTVHQLQVSGDDLAGLSLAPGPAPNPWTFKTFCTDPFIISTDPTNLHPNVALTVDIAVTFSEPMDTASVTWTITPAITLDPTWSAGDTVLNLSHVDAFAPCTVYTVGTAGQDVDGNSLIPGPVANPWRFMAACANPFIFATTPVDGETNVDPMADIFVTFNEPMDTASVQVTITPTIPLTPFWSGGNTGLRVEHQQPFPCGVTTVEVTGQDLDGNPLVAGFVPNPWSFSPACPNPYIVSTDPPDGAQNVALDKAIVVTFNEPMDTASVTWTIAPAIQLDPTWSAGDTVLTLSHVLPFTDNTLYTAQIAAGLDLDGNPLILGPVPNPWSFATVGVPPFIVLTDPADLQTDVPTDAIINVTFSEPMDTASVTWTIAPGISVTPAWFSGDTILTLTPTSPLAECVTYTVDIAGRDTGGLDLVAGPVPNPWSFQTVCFSPFIVSTDPPDGAIDVALDKAIVVTFSEPMNVGTVSWTITPAIQLDPTWSAGDTVLTLAHTELFAECTMYEVTLSGQDLDGNQLASGPVPNPWRFTTFCPPPYVVSTVPADEAVDVPTTADIVVTFSGAMDTNTVTWVFTPAVAAAPTWTNGDTVLTLTPLAPLVDCTRYDVLVAGQDTNGKDLVPGPVPNPWQFDTVCTVPAPSDLQVTRVPPSTIRLSWNAVAGADRYRVYESGDRFAPWPWGVLGETTTTTFDAAHYADGLTHYYIVRAVRAATESPNSTMGVKVQLSVGFNSASSNIRWFSLPYRSPYARASDIAAELGPSRIDVVAKWDATTQRSILYYYFRGQWRGTDFTISAGDGLYIGSVSAFDWVIAGTDRDLTLSFAPPPPRGNVYWISLPYTSAYARASDIVLDIEGSIGPGANTKIVEIAKWDAVTQTTIRFFWTAGGWSGADFSISPGDGIYFRVVAGFSWQPNLVTPEVP